MTEAHLAIEELLSSDDCWLWKTLVVARDLNLLTVLEGLLYRVVRWCREVSEFAVDLCLKLCCNLVSTACDDVDALVDVACWGVELN